MLKRLQTLINSTKGEDLKDLVNSISMGVNEANTKAYLGFLSLYRKGLIAKHTIESIVKMIKFASNKDNKKYYNTGFDFCEQGFISFDQVTSSIRRQFVMQGLDMPGVILIPHIEKIDGVPILFARYLYLVDISEEEGLKFTGAVWIPDGKGNVCSYLEARGRKASQITKRLQNKDTEIIEMQPY